MPRKRGSVAKARPWPSDARTHLMLQKLTALSLSILLVSCSAPRHAGPSPAGEKDAVRQVLVIEKTPEGQVTHSWKPASHFDLSKYAYAISSSGSFTGSLVRVAANRDCEEERDQCEEMCKASLTGANWTHASVGSKARICRDRCRPAYLDCSKLQERAEAVKFSTTDKAVDWLKSHREELLVGTVVVIAGVAFAVAVVGSGGVVVVLVPAVFLVSTEAPSEPYAVGSKP